MVYHHFSNEDFVRIAFHHNDNVTILLIQKEARKLFSELKNKHNVLFILNDSINKHHPLEKEKSIVVSNRSKNYE